MSRYIDADEIKRQWEIYGSLDVMDRILADVFPTADVVPVVRCKDCKYGEVDDKDFPDQYLCLYHGCDWNKGDHFCGYGEKVSE